MGARAIARAPRDIRSWCTVAILGAALAAAGRARADTPPREPVPRPTPPPSPPLEVDTTTTHTVDGHVISQTGPGRAIEPGPAADTAHVVPFGGELWGEIGAGGSVAPTEVKRLFGAGYSGSVMARWRARPNVSLLATAAFQSLPRTEIVVISSGVQAGSFRLGGDGTMYSILLGPGVRLWKRLWIEGGAGVAHLAVGAGPEAIGPLDEPVVMTRIRNTYGPALRAGVAWRFPITDSRSMSVSAGWETMHAGDSGKWLQQASARLGYQFFH